LDLNMAVTKQRQTALCKLNLKVSQTAIITCTVIMADGVTVSGSSPWITENTKNPTNTCDMVISRWH